MRSKAILVVMGFSLLCGFSPQETPIVRGTVSFRGSPPPGKKFNVFGLAERLYPKGIVIDPVPVDQENRIPDCLVYVRKGLEKRSFKTPAEPKRIAFDRYLLKPRMLALMVGQELIQENLDSELHNIHALPFLNKETNKGLPTQGARESRTFTEPELGIRMYCDVHYNWENAWVTVLPHPYYAVTDEHGSFEIPGLPPGKYELEAWQENCMAARQMIEVKPGGPVLVEFILEMSPPLRNDVWTVPAEESVFKELMDKPVEVEGGFELLPSGYTPPNPLKQGRRYVRLSWEDRVQALCGLAPGEEQRLKDLPSKSFLRVRGTFRGKVPSEGAHFAMEDGVVVKGLKFGK
jgi:hypothetical protein